VDLLLLLFLQLFGLDWTGWVLMMMLLIDVYWMLLFLIIEWSMVVIQHRVI